MLRLDCNVKAGLGGVAAKGGDRVVSRKDVWPAAAAKGEVQAKGLTTV